MKCPYCGAENEDDAYVCTSCGMPLKRSHPHYEDEDPSNNEDDFFESDMYDDPKKTQSDLEADSIGDETIAADEDTIFYQKENIDDTDEEEPRNESFSFDEEDDEEDEEPFEDVIPQESKLDALKNKFKSFKKEKAEPEYEDEEDEEEEEPVHRAGDRVKSFFNDEDEEDYETDQAREDNLEGVYDEEERRPRRASSIRIIPFKVLILILVVAAVVGGILMMRNKSANNTSTTTKTTTVVKPVIASVKASSTLRETGYDHSADLMIDGDLTTAWQEGVTGDGIGQYATFTLKNKAPVKSCSIANGYDKSSYLYTRNNRVKEATFTFDDGTSETHTLKDQYNTYSNITFNKTHKTKTIKITITSIYRGTYYHDTCISEVKFA